MGGDALLAGRNSCVVAECCCSALQYVLVYVMYIMSPTEGFYYSQVSFDSSYMVVLRAGRISRNPSLKPFDIVHLAVS